MRQDNVEMVPPCRHFRDPAFFVRCLADRSEGPLPPCSCRRRRCSCTPPASASSPTPAKDIESRPNHVDSWSPAREELMGKHTYVHTYIHTYIRTYVHTYIHTNKHTDIPTYIHTHTHYTYMHMSREKDDLSKSCELSRQGVCLGARLTCACSPAEELGL